MVILVIALIYRLTNPFEQETIERLTYAPATKVSTGKTTLGSPDRESVMVGIMDATPGNDNTVRRDLFRPANAGQAPVESSAASPPPASTPPPISEIEKVQEHFRRFKAFGSYRRGEKQYLFLQRGKQVLVIKRGDRIDGKFEVIEVADKSATIAAQNISEPLKINFDEL
jgi:hypothetical protein